MDTVTVSLNGREVTGAPGTTILDLAKQVGETIPTLCHHPLLRNVGACRVCLVEEVKSGRVMASCITPISPGMEILTHSPSAVRARRGVLELILSDHPSSCVVCSKGNRCTLRDLAQEHGICDPELDPIRRWRPMEEVNPFIVRDLTKCVLCGRCIRVCKDVEAVGAVDYADRGYESHPGTAERTPLEGSECTFCGSCVAICPTDALAERDKHSLSSDLSLVRGICSYCGTGCHLQYELVDGSVVGARGVVGSPMNGLSLCVRGRYGQEALSSPDRLMNPRVRNEEGQMSTATWDEALDRVAGSLKEILERHGPTSIGLLMGTQCSNEEFYLAGRFARALLGSPHVDSTARFTSATPIEGLSASLRRSRTTADLNGLEEAHTIILVSARPDHTHPVIAAAIRRAVRNHGTRLIQFDPLTTSLSPFATVRFTEHTDEQIKLLVSIMKQLVARNLYNRDFLDGNVKNSEEFVAAMRPQPSEESAQQEIVDTTELIGSERRVYIVLGPPAAKATQGYILTRLVTDLAILCGQPDNILFLHEGSNELGAWEMGCAPDRLPGGFACGDPAAVNTLGPLWAGGEIAFHRGLDAMEMLREAEKGRLKALVLLGVDPLAVFPDSQRTKQTLAATDFVVRVGMFPAVIEETAHVVLPSAAVTEMDGTYVNVEGRVQRVRKIVDPPGSARPIARILLDLAGRLGPPLGFLTARDIFDEIREACPAWKDLSWAQVGDPGGMTLGNVDPKNANGEGDPRDTPLVPYTPPDSLTTGTTPSEDYPWRVIPEEPTLLPGDGVVARRSPRLCRFEEHGSVRMHPDDAAQIGIEQSARAILSSSVARVETPLVLDRDVPRAGVVVSTGGPDYLLQKLAPWPEEFCPPGWDRIFVSIARVEE